jgi:hypothetical protein
VDHAPPAGFIAAIPAAASVGVSSTSNRVLRLCGDAWSERATTFGSKVVCFIPSGPKTFACIASSYATAIGCFGFAACAAT